MSEVEKVAEKNWHLRVNLATAILLLAWIPVRIDFMPNADWDRLVDLFVFCVMGWNIYTVYSRRKKEDAADRSDSELVQIAIDLVIALPLLTLAHSYFNTSELLAFDEKYLLLPKVLIVRHLFSIRDILYEYDGLHPILERLIPLIVTMPLLVHMLACGWVWLGAGTVGLDPAGDKILDYARALYWAITTLSTVGYGDISAKTIPQMAFASCTMIVGVGFFGYVLSNVASMLARLDAARVHHLDTLDQVESFMRYNHLPLEIRGRIRSYYRYIWETRKGYDSTAIVEQFPHSLKLEVSMHLNKGIIEKVPLLKGAEPSLVQDIVLEMQPLICIPGDRVFNVGDPGDGMYFIHNGAVDIISKEKKVLATLHSGSFFGETALVTAGNRNATVVARTYCDLFVLNRDAFERVIARYPTFHEHIHEAVKKRTA